MCQDLERRKVGISGRRSKNQNAKVGIGNEHGIGVHSCLDWKVSEQRAIKVSIHLIDLVAARP